MQEALPFWVERGVDRRFGGVVESLTLDASGDAGAGFKRARVACRQIYAFSHGELLGYGPAAAAADHAYHGLIAQFWGGAETGWLRRVSPQGAPIDATPDLYDYAFVLFALGWRYKLRRDAATLALAHQTLDLIEAWFPHPFGAGFHAALPGVLPREQNPHMHLTEAALVLAETSGEARFFKLADDVVGLFKTRIVKPDTGVLAEFFDDDWRAIEGERGRHVEPGHQFEWAWILAQHQRLTGADHREIVATLVAFAETHGVDPQTHITYNAVRDDGAPIDRGSRTWPNTERVKGWIGHAELNGASAWPQIETSLQVLMERYLAPAPRGCWIDAFDAQGRPAVNSIPASTLYHVFLAFAEALRFAEARS